MKIHVLSDLHLEVAGPYTIPLDLEYDVLVVAGDLCNEPESGMEFLRAVQKPVVFVLGNHDYWDVRRKTVFGSAPKNPVSYQTRLAEWKRLAEGTDVHVLENESVIIDGVRFLGCTLWTSCGGGNVDLMRIAERKMNDFAYIGSGDWFERHPEALKQYAHALYPDQENIYLKQARDIERRFHPLIAAGLHAESVAFLDDMLGGFREDCESADDAYEHTVVVTHHAPSWKVLMHGGLVLEPIEQLTSLDRIQEVRERTQNFWRLDRDESPLYRLAAYASPMDQFLARRARNVTWIHGHTHAATDIVVAGTRVVCNPRGYFADDVSGFNPQLVIDPADGIRQHIQACCDEAIERLLGFKAKLRALRPSVSHRNPALREAVREKVLRLSDELSRLMETTAGFLNDALVTDTAFGIRQHLLMLHAGGWRARYGERCEFPLEVQEWDVPAGLEDCFSRARQECADGRITQVVKNIDSFVHDLRRVPCWRDEIYPRELRKFLRPVMKRLRDAGANPELRPHGYGAALSIMVDDDFNIQSVDLSGLDNPNGWQVRVHRKREWK